MEREKAISEDEINLLDLLIVLVKRAKLILALTFGCALITGLISFILPPVYKAETKILSPLNSPSSFNQLSQLAQFEQFSAFLNIKDPSELCVSLMKSNTILDRIIDRFQLLKRYKTKHRVDGRKILLNNLRISIDKKSGIITIGVFDRDPKFAADMANAFVEELKNFTRGLAVTEAAQRRLFFEEQLKDVKMALIKAEEEMKAFQEKTGVISVEDQAKVVIESIANLRAQIAAKEVEIKVMRTYLTPNNPDLQKAEEQLKALRIELAKLEAKSGRNPDPLVPTGKMPTVTVEYLRQLRELKFLETLYELLLKGYEKAKLDEANDAVVIQVIDKAMPPEKKAKPKRRQMVLLATLIGFFVSILLAFILEYIERTKEDENNRKRLETIKAYLKQIRH